jgi:hypothetical protein
MTPETRRALERAFWRALDPDAVSESTPGLPGEIEGHAYAQLTEELQTIVDARMRKIPDEISERLRFAVRQGPEAVRAVIAKAIGDALRELAAQR